VYAYLNRYDEALLDFTQAIKLDPNLAAAYMNVGMLLVRLGAHLQALPYLEKAEHLGFSQAAEYVKMITQAVEELASQQSDPVPFALAALYRANSSADVELSVTRFPSMKNPGFVAGVEVDIKQSVPLVLRPLFEQRLTWLKQLAEK
jgi:tetratricopeptide (TPR) repeat protein